MRSRVSCFDGLELQVFTAIYCNLSIFQWLIEFCLFVRSVPLFSVMDAFDRDDNHPRSDSFSQWYHAKARSVTTQFIAN